MSDLRSYFVVMPVVVPDEPNACRIEFKVGNQMFRIGPEYCEDREQAEWFIDMACKALRTLIADFALRATSETKPVSACEREGCNETRAIGGHFCPRHDQGYAFSLRPAQETSTAPSSDLDYDEASGSVRVKPEAMQRWVREALTSRGMHPNCTPPCPMCDGEETKSCKHEIAASQSEARRYCVKCGQQF